MDEIITVTGEDGKLKTKYAESVSFPLIITGYDTAGKKAETVSGLSNKYEYGTL